MCENIRLHAALVHVKKMVQQLNPFRWFIWEKRHWLCGLLPLTRKMHPRFQRCTHQVWTQDLWKFWLLSNIVPSSGSILISVIIWIHSTSCLTLYTYANGISFFWLTLYTYAQRNLQLQIEIGRGKNKVKKWCLELYYSYRSSNPHLQRVSQSEKSYVLMYRCK